MSALNCDDIDGLCIEGTSNEALKLFIDAFAQMVITGSKNCNESLKTTLRIIDLTIIKIR